MKRIKKILWTSVFLILVFVLGVDKKDIYADSQLNLTAYLSSWDEVFLLEKQIIQKSIFTIEDNCDSEITRQGTTSKHILIDQDGQKWLFKISFMFIVPVVVEKNSRILRICGFNSPLLVTKKININGVEYFGSLQKLVDVEKLIYNAGDLISLPRHIQESTFAQEVIGYLFASNSEMLLSKKQELFFIDLNNVLLFPAKSKQPSKEEFRKIATKRNNKLLGQFDEFSFSLLYESFLQVVDLSICERWTDLYIDKVRDKDNSSDEKTESHDHITEAELMAHSDDKMPYKSQEIIKRLHQYFFRESINSLGEKTFKTIDLLDSITASYFNVFFESEQLAESLIYGDYVDSVLSRKQNLKNIFISFYSTMPQVYDKNIFSAKYTQKEIDDLTTKLSVYRTQLKARLKSLSDSGRIQPALEHAFSPEADALYQISKVAKLLDERRALNALYSLYGKVNAVEKKVIRNYIKQFQETLN